ncbi:TPA: hypothetical protein ACOEOC_003107 [Stenotrophomonas maltophilia]|uniref:hypothetical protein n=1 Tax=Stenotrophomonas maltophilia TaxID=40324 RepID=UPI0013DC7057|nr:hypothetical protein [Stenotrophomonas maltophilia]MBA0302145.1 hypothetical protein [Stenotrophomonas maltophilia]MBH1584519.1 hypothetical protein [Stenotrophomonas maltophilia]MBH1685836.1 hypothetical protein [Stenotrophomonas maltophilia]MBN5011532.1 hypothetical protein [Stenotrophomonas maltophilia]HDS1299529.1 hypothetical protein [Stenotrophomonas maltophilia]
MKQLNAMGMLLVVTLALAGCKQEPALTQTGEINLAGCEVPAGITQEAAEKIECANGGHAADPDASAMDAGSEEPLATANVSALVADGTNLGREQGETSDAEVIQTAIAARAAQDGGSEYIDARRSIEGDLNGDGTADVAVLYSLEGGGGGNGSVGYLAAFVRTDGQLKLSDTATLSGSAQRLSLKGGAAHVGLLTLGPDDSACCPSVEEDAMYVLHGNKWLQIQSQP